MSISFAVKPLPSIHFGVGSLQLLPNLLLSYGLRFLILTGSQSLQKAVAWKDCHNRLTQVGCDLDYCRISGEPDPETIDRLSSRYHQNKPDAVISVGGGSVLDAGKAVSAMIPGGEPVLQFLEGVGTRKPDGRKVPFVAVPTTAGTGSEVTSNAVISKIGSSGFKKSLRHDRYIPDLTIVDPELTRTCSPEVTSRCGMDAFTQLVEGYLSNKSSLFTDSLAWSGIEAVHRSLAFVYQNGEDLAARSDMAYASLCSGVVLANAGLGLVHGIAPVLGSLHSIPHGAVCGTLMAAANEATLKRCEEKLELRALAKYSRLGRLFSQIENKSETYYREAFIVALHDLTEQLALPKLGALGVHLEDTDRIAAQSGNKNNPVHLSSDEIAGVLTQRL